MKFKQQKKLGLALAAALLVSPISLSLPAGQAKVAAANAKFSITNQSFSIEGVKSSIGTINSNGSTFIALRNLNTALGLGTNFDKTTQSVTVTGHNRIMKLDLKNKTVTLNGQLINGQQVIVQDNTTYLPLRFLLERLGYEVTYTSASKQIGIKAIAENKLTIEAHSLSDNSGGKKRFVYYPVISGMGNTEVQTKINALLKQEAEKTIALASQHNEYDVISNSNLKGEFEVTYNEKGKLSLYTYYGIDSGGAHDLHNLVPHTFDLNTGNELSLKDVTEGKANYVTIINDQIKKQIKDRKLDVITPFKTIEANRDFYLSHNGVVIYFTEGELLGAAQGFPRFVIPFSAFNR
ncbi:stalk domain-containing protein [Paenibacillus glycanilyticus]|uniref:stalk domain-containing protein n=1 Tax=Paenibacillus glycanilyticus TaxID=126569 RepID=UPI0013E2AFDA|nr:stalk domain-containing protein [Paenibacillus glycanilyticus]